MHSQQQFACLSNLQHNNTSIHQITKEAFCQSKAPVTSLVLRLSASTHTQLHPHTHTMGLVRDNLRQAAGCIQRAAPRAREAAEVQVV